MKNPRPKLREEMEKNQAKIAELQARNRELQKKIRESENTDILGLIRAVNMTPEELAEFLKQAKPSAKLPVLPDEEETEEPDDEEP
jgi:predicted nuclease with TOPRIM domain